MKLIKKYWYILTLTIITLGMGVVALITSGKLTNPQPVAPTVPQVTPQAAAPACTLSFDLTTPTPVPACNDACTVDSDCATGFICSEGSCRNPECTAEESCECAPTETVTPTPLLSCNEACSADSDCGSDLICSDGYCRNSECTAEESCECKPTETPTPTPPASCNEACTVNADCSGDLICVGNACRNASCTDETDCSCNATPTPTPPATCNDYCSVNSDCDSGLVCVGNSCRNPNCTSETDCSCPGGSTSTPTPTPNLADCNNSCSINADCQGGLVCSSGYCRNASCTEKTNCTCDVIQSTPKTPIAGTGPSVLGASIIGSGLLLILLGLAL